MIVDVPIEQFGLKGQGVGHDDEGNIYFVPGAVPGDYVRVETSELTKRYRDAILLSVLKPSPHRREAPCPYFRTCGGCDWLDVDYPEQLHQKSNILNHVLERAVLPTEKLSPFIGSAQIYGYRSRIQLKRESAALGFYKKLSHDLVEIDRCAIADESLNKDLELLRSSLSSLSFKSVELIADGEGSVRRVYDAPHGAEGFTQVNRAQNEILRGLVRERVVVSQSKNVLELFCGDGNLTFAFCGDVTHTVGIDASVAAITKAQDMAKQRSDVTFISTPLGSGSVVGKLPVWFKDQYDTLVLDPPRAGAGPSLGFFVKNTVRHIIYISCSPLSFSLDLRLLKKLGFRLLEVQGLDMFPHTRHIEMVATLTRS
jgi:23S rRNA (uracil1939-C5)-methyltransferase